MDYDGNNYLIKYTSKFKKIGFSNNFYHKSNKIL